MTNVNNKVAIQFLRGKDENDNPEIRLFRNHNGNKSHAIYKFHKLSTITIENYKSINKMYLLDIEGEISTNKIDIFISDNLIKEVSSTYNWNSLVEFERFMRFAERYAKSITN